MQMGMVGLGRMGASMVQRLMRGGHECVASDENAEAVASVAHEGALGVSSLDALAAALKKPRVVWMMVPAAVVEQTVDDLSHRFERGWLLDLTATALAADPALSQFAGRVSDSGEGRWTITAAIDQGVPAHVLTAAYERFSSRGEADFADRLRSAMRFQFGGHHERGSTAGSVQKRGAS